jgi:uncharacterized protein (TIGR00369 family)
LTKKKFIELPNMEHNTCFGCGPANDHGLKMKFFGNDEMLYSDIKVPDYLLGWNGVVHGGILSTILDEVMGWSAIFLMSKFILTKTMTINYHRPVFVGEMLHVEGKVKEKISDREASMSGRIYNSKNELCVSSSGIFALFEVDHVKKMGIMKDKDLEDFQKILNAHQGL